MVLNKRVVKGAESHVDFGYVASMSDKADLHQAVRHQTMAGILGQLSTLLSYANELYADLHRELSNDAQRISALAARTQAAYDYLPHLETYIHNTGPEEFINRGGSEYKQKGGEDCQLLSPGTRATATVVVYDTECVPPPDLSPLDPYREDGRPCIKDYTNPAFFVEEWIAEQKRQAQEARRRREKSRKTKQDERGVLRRANEAVEVKKLKKTRYNQWGEKIQDGDDDGAVAAPSREATKSAPRVEATTAPKELTESSKGHKKREKKTLFKGKEKEKEKEQTPEEKLEAFIFEKKVEYADKLLKDKKVQEFDDLSRALVSAKPDHLPLLVLNLKRAVSGKNVTEIAAAADAVVANIDTTSLALHLAATKLGTKPEGSEAQAAAKATKEKEKQLDALLSALTEKTLAVATAALATEDAGGKAALLAEADATLEQLKKWANVTGDSKYYHLLAALHRARGQLATALKYVSKQYKELADGGQLGEQERGLYEQRVELVRQLGWAHWESHLRAAKHALYPAKYSLF